MQHVSIKRILEFITMYTETVPLLGHHYCYTDLNIVNMTNILLLWPKYCHRDKMIVTITKVVSLWRNYFPDVSLPLCFQSSTCISHNTFTVRGLDICFSTRLFGSRESFGKCVHFIWKHSLVDHTQRK